MQWYTANTATGTMTLCERCAANEPDAAPTEPYHGSQCDLCGRQDADDDEQAQIRQALYLCRAQLELAQPLFAERRRRHDLVKQVDFEVGRSYTKPDAEWKQRSRRLLDFVRRWLDANDLSEDGPTTLGGAE